MARTMLEDDAASPPQKSQADIISDVAGLVYFAGSDTTVAAVHSFFLAMLIYPEVQAKAQAEIDRVLGKDKLPELADRKDMPYVEGVVNECLRWLPVTPMGQLSLLKGARSQVHTAVHQTTQDDEYKGYAIPKGAIVLASVWCVHCNRRLHLD
jgi:cytochrome P450